MARDNQLTIYVEDDLKQELERNAADEDQTVSTYAASLLERQLQADATDQITREQDAEERLNELIALGKDELIQMGTEITELQQDIRELHAKTGVYAVANWEVLKQGVDDDARRDALSTGSKRLRDDRDPADAEPGSDESGDDDDDREGPLERIREADDSTDDDRNIFDELREDRE